jgi:hypothetical protein
MQKMNNNANGNKSQTVDQGASEHNEFGGDLKDGNSGVMRLNTERKTPEDIINKALNDTPFLTSYKPEYDKRQTLEQMMESNKKVALEDNLVPKFKGSSKFLTSC